MTITELASLAGGPLPPVAFEAVAALPPEEWVALCMRYHKQWSNLTHNTAIPDRHILFAGFCENPFPDWADVRTVIEARNFTAKWLRKYARAGHRCDRHNSGSLAVFDDWIREQIAF